MEHYKTLSVARSPQRQYGSLSILDLRRHYGKSTAIREGVKAARGNVIAFFDADIQYNPIDLVRMVASARERADVVSGSRDYGTYGRARTMISRTYNKVLRLLFKVTLSDSNCGVRGAHPRGRGSRCAPEIWTTADDPSTRDH